MEPTLDLRFALTLEGAAAQLLNHAAAALYEEAELIMADSREHYVPVDEAILKGSGHVQEPELKNGEIRVTLAYGGPAADYAIVQHEELGYQHTVGGPKYLERPLIAHADALPRDLAARIRAKAGL